MLKLELKGDERVLDIGCGDGKVTAEVAKLLTSGSILGVDNSEEMIHFARKNFPLKEFPNLAFEVRDAKSLSFNSEFDVVFSNASLHWIVDHLAVLEGIEKSLKPSGKVFLQMAGRGSGSKIVGVPETNLKSGKWSIYLKDFSYPYGFLGLRSIRAGWSVLT